MNEIEQAEERTRNAEDVIAELRAENERLRNQNEWAIAINTALRDVASLTSEQKEQWLNEGPESTASILRTALKKAESERARLIDVLEGLLQDCGYTEWCPVENARRALREIKNENA